MLTSGAGAYNFGAYSADILAAGLLVDLFDLHWVVVSAPDTNANYEIDFVYGATDTTACVCKFSRTNVFNSSITLPLMTIRMPAGSRIRARMRDSAGGSTARVSVFYHTYP